MITSPLLIVAVLALCVALSDWLVRRTAARHLGSALLVIVITAVVANLKLIPTYTVESSVYDGIFRYLAPLAIFWLLLGVHLKDVARAGLPMISLFLIGSLGTVAGVVAGMSVVGGSQAFGDLHHALAGMFVATYTGGSVNFNAVALHYGVVEKGVLYAGAAAVDSAMTTVWMAVTVAVPRLLASWAALRGSAAESSVGSTALTGVEEDTETVHPLDISVLVAMGALTVGLASAGSSWSARALGVEPPPILIVTTIALLLAQLPAVRRLKGARLCGMLAVMFFLAAIGALCDVSALGSMGALGGQLTLFVSVVVLVHGLIVFGAAALLRLDPALAAVASQANVGGGTSALALARSLGRSDLVLPAILVGSLGTSIGTYLGFATARLLQG